MVIAEVQWELVYLFGISGGARKQERLAFIRIAQDKRISAAEMYAIFSHLRAFLKYTALSRVHKNVTLMARS